MSSDPISRAINSIQAELAMEDDKVDAFYRAMGKSEGEISSYRQTRYRMRKRTKLRKLQSTISEKERSEILAKIKLHMNKPI